MSSAKSKWKRGHPFRFHLHEVKLCKIYPFTITVAIWDVYGVIKPQNAQLYKCQCALTSVECFFFYIMPYTNTSICTHTKICFVLRAQALKFTCTLQTPWETKTFNEIQVKMGQFPVLEHVYTHIHTHKHKHTHTKMYTQNLCEKQGHFTFSAHCLFQKSSISTQHHPKWL